MATLVSPGVSVTIIDESQYAGAGPGTVPLFIIATHSNKPLPGDDLYIAEGTLPAQAGTLKLMTSQRDVLQTYGDPTYYRLGTQTPVQELNEYGLLSLYQYMGVANRAWVMRANIPLEQLIPSKSAPRGEANNGTYWLDVNDTQFGVFTSNGSAVTSSSWVPQTELKIDKANEIYRVIRSGLSVSSGSIPIITSNGALVINDITIGLTTGLTLTQVINQINTVLGTSAPTIKAKLYRLAEQSSLMIYDNGGNEIIINDSSDTSILNDLGLVSPGVNIPLPSFDLGVEGTISITTLLGDNVVYQKLTAQTFSGQADPAGSAYWYAVGTDEWKAATPTVVIGRTGVQSIIPGNIISVNGINVALTGNNSTTIVADAVNNINNTAGISATGVVARQLPNGALQITNALGRDVNLSWNQAEPGNVGAPNALYRLGLVTDASKINLTKKGNQLYYATHTQVPVGSVVGDVWIKTTEPNNGAKWIVRVYDQEAGIWSNVLAPLYATDAAATASYSGNVPDGTLYVQYNLYGTSTNPIGSHQLRRYSSPTNTWEPLEYEANASEPTTDPEDGTIWFNDDYKVDIMVNDGNEWVGYRTLYPATDPSGVQVQDSAPTTQSDRTPLEENDLWINTSDMENYPVINRWDSNSRKWRRIDTTDQTTMNGIVFADARSASSGKANASTAIADMLMSSFLDPDAPDPRAYPMRTLLFNTRYSTHDVKVWQSKWFDQGGYDANIDYSTESYTVGAAIFDPLETLGRWVNVSDRVVLGSGLRLNGSPLMGRRAQRAMIVRELQQVVASNQDIRSELIYFNLLSAPGYVELIDELVGLNFDQKEISFIVGDTPIRLKPSGTDINNWATNKAGSAGPTEDGLPSVNNAYVGIYYPWGLTSNTDGSDVMLPPSGIALRTIAYNDQIAYPWFAPAGFNRGIVTNASSVGYLTNENEFKAVFLNQGQRDVLYLNRINPIAYIPNRGLVVYGQKTLYGQDSALDRINVARLVNYLKYHCDLLAKPFLFEPNDEQTRKNVQGTFNSFFSTLYGLRALEDYAVICDTSNNTPDRRNRNELWIDIFIIPTKAIEFIYIPVRIRRSGASLSNS